MMKKRNVIRLLAVIFAVGLVFSLVWYGYERREEKNRYTAAYEEIFTTERETAASVYDAVGAALKAGGTADACVEASKISDTAGYVCFQTYAKNYALFSGHNRTGTAVYYGTFYRDITDALAEGCDAARLENIHALLGKILALYDKHTEPADVAQMRQEVNSFYEALMNLSEEMRSIS